MLLIVCFCCVFRMKQPTSCARRLAARSSAERRPTVAPASVRRARCSTPTTGRARVTLPIGTAQCTLERVSMTIFKCQCRPRRVQRVGLLRPAMHQHRPQLQVLVPRRLRARRRQPVPGNECHPIPAVLRSPSAHHENRRFRQSRRGTYSELASEESVSRCQSPRGHHYKKMKSHAGLDVVQRPWGG